MTAEELRDRAQHCRDLARVTRDKVVEKELLRLASEFDAEAEVRLRKAPNQQAAPMADEN